MTDSLPLRVLPFRTDSFDWNRFESFCLAIVRSLPDVKRADRYGTTGEKQNGIDIEADLIDGRKRTIQCRHRKSITKPQVEKTVADTTFDADEHEIWVTCQVGKNVSDFIDSLDGWLIESGEGIGQRVRLELRRERARVIVRDAFGARVARDFLGPGGPIAFLSPEDYFATFDHPARLLRHDLPLVGRRDELGAITRAADDELVKVVLVPGRGGIGKTRLLREAAADLDEMGKRVLLAADGAALTPEVVDDLPLDDVVVVVDDAHRADVALGSLLIAARHRSDPLTVLLGVRPGGEEQVIAATAAAQMEPRQVVAVPRLKPLSRKDVLTLAALALDEQSERGERLALATSELPLLTVLGGRMMARGDFAGDAASGGAELRRNVLRRFVDEQRGKISSRVPENKAQRLLVLLAALNPIDTSDAVLVDLVAQELGVTSSQIRRWLGDIQDAGLLLARGALRRLTPDVLADEVLYEACLDPQGRPTGRAVELWRRYSPHAQTQLLANLGELDWRTTANGESLLTDVWKGLIDGFRQMDAWGREQFIEKIAPAAFFWPTQVLELVDAALQHPAETTDWGLVDLRIDDGSVREKIPSLLRAVGRHPRYARDVMDRLWLLARDDRRDTNPHPEHGLRLIRELGGYESGPAHHDALLDLVEAELAKPELSEHANSPLPLVDALLSREGMRSFAVDGEWQMRSYLVGADSSQRWRQRVRSLLVEQALRGAPRERTAAAKLFQTALRLPFGYFGRPVPTDVRDSWRPDQSAILDAIAAVAARSDDAAVRVELADALDWHARHGPWDDLSERAAELITALHGEDEEFFAALAKPWDLRDLDEKAERDQRVASRLLERFESGADLAAYLNDAIGQVQDRQMATQPDPSQILRHVVESSPAYASAIWDWSVEHPDTWLAPAGALALGALRRSGSNVDERLRAAAKSPSVVLRRVAASYLCEGAWFARPSSAEASLLESMASDEDPGVRGTIAIALLRLRPHQPGLAVNQALTARIDPGDGRGADMLFSTIHEFGVAKLDPADLSQLTEQLVLVSDPGYFAHQVLEDLGDQSAQRVIDVWWRRLSREDTERHTRYQSVPFHDYGVEMLGDTSGDERIALHSQLLAQLGELPSWRLGELGRIYWRLALPGLPDDDPAAELVANRSTHLNAALAAVERYLTTAEPDVERLAELVSELPWQAVLADPQWVGRLLEVEDSTAVERLKSSLEAAAIGGLHGRTLGEDSPRWTATRAGAQTALKQVLPGSPGATFFASLARHAQRQIDDERSEDEQRRSGWQ